jgi:hypothetical protein
MPLRGSYRVKTLEGIPDAVWVTEDGVGFEVSEPVYIKQRIEPPLDTLPWDTSIFGAPVGPPSKE